MYLPPYTKLPVSCLPPRCLMMNVEQQLGMSLEELISLDAHEVPGRSLLHELRALDNNLSLADKLCMSIDDILAHSKVHASSPRTCQRPRRRTNQVTHLRRIFFPP